MKQITIVINVPDGVQVSVNGAGQQAQPSRPFVSRPDPAYPGGECPVHGVDWKLVPAGTSRTKFNADGSPKRFNAFWTCPERGCNERPPRPQDGDYVEEVLPF